MRAVGIFGGTFDPIHSGHLITALVIKELRNLEKIIFIPAYVSPHKVGHSHSDSIHRLNMINLAIKDINGFESSDLEITNNNISYTIDTIHRLKELYNNIELIIGYDNLLVFDKWKDPDEILKLATVVVLNRKSENKEEKNRFYNKAFFVNTPVIEISSTEIRKRVKENLPVNFFIPEPVKEYIIKHKLYKD
jgi:nicotinate-nucleotide adenylyltransferase